jgi:hypothetical protein
MCNQENHTKFELPFTAVLHRVAEYIAWFEVFVRLPALFTWRLVIQFQHRESFTEVAFDGVVVRPVRQQIPCVPVRGAWCGRR